MPAAPAKSRQRRWRGDEHTRDTHMIYMDVRGLDRGRRNGQIFIIWHMRLARRRSAAGTLLDSEHIWEPSDTVEYDGVTKAPTSAMKSSVNRRLLIANHVRARALNDSSRLAAGSDDDAAARPSKREAGPPLDRPPRGSAVVRGGRGPGHLERGTLRRFIPAGRTLSSACPAQDGRARTRRRGGRRRRD